MEWGLLLAATSFISLPSVRANAIKTQQQSRDVVFASLVEQQRWRDSRSACTAHKEGLHDITSARTGGSAAGSSILADIVSGEADLSWCARFKGLGYAPPRSSLRGSDSVTGDSTSGPFESPWMNKLFNAVVAALLWIFNTRILQLALGSTSVVLLLGLMRLCYTRWKLSSTKTF
jgi:hypothetical protein